MSQKLPKDALFYGNKMKELTNEELRHLAVSYGWKDETDEDRLKFSRKGVYIWEVREGFQVADLHGGFYVNHRPFDCSRTAHNMVHLFLHSEPVTYQGFQNTQTWAVALTINNTKEYQDKALEIVKRHKDATLKLKKWCERHISKDCYDMAPWAWNGLGFQPHKVAWLEIVKEFKTELNEQGGGQ